jgi:hypothetical protein
MRHLAAFTLLATLALSSGCYSLTNMAVVGLALGTPSKVDPRQPDVAVKDVVGVSVTQAQGGYLLHLAVLREDGRVVRLVASEAAPPVAPLVGGNAAPVVVTFAAEGEGALPAPAIPLVVPDWEWIDIDDHRQSVPASQLGVGSEVHRVREDGLIPEETVTLTAGLAAKCGIVSLHLVRDKGEKAMRRQTWQVSFYPPRLQAEAPAAALAVLFPGQPTLLTEDGALFGPLPPTWSVLKTAVFVLVAPPLLALDTFQWCTGLGAAIDLPIALHYGWLTASTE